MEEFLGSMPSKRHTQKSISPTGFRHKSLFIKAHKLRYSQIGRLAYRIGLQSPELRRCKIDRVIGSPLSLLQLNAADHGKSWILFVAPLF